MDADSENILSKPCEWDFRAVPENELYLCAIWEYARESERIRAVYQKEESLFFPAPPMRPGYVSPGGIVVPPRREIVEPLRLQFIKQLWDYSLPLKMILDRLDERPVDEGIFDIPWQELRQDVRNLIIQDFAPYISESPALTYLPFNRCSDLRDLGIADEDYRCASFDSKYGIERFRVEIDWAGFTDAQIIKAFSTWIAENRPKKCGRRSDKGKRKAKGYHSQLTWVSIMRLMHFYSFTSIDKRLPRAFELYRSADWPRARESAGRQFRNFFPYLPEEDRPRHWQTAGGRSV